MREAYLDGLSEEEGIPFRIQQGDRPEREQERRAAGEGPVTRKVAAGTAVIDLEAMKRELEANPAARRRT